MYVCMYTHTVHELAETHGLLPIFLFLELTLIRFSLRAASFGKYLAGPYPDERFGSDISKMSTVFSAVLFVPFL